ncbi:MAG: hypothetical protein IIA48_05690 [Bacteroidetes bacterium]|nr:hypothetical protein [Bacteroidota bacterium]
MSNYKLTFKLKQHTPIIHFQHDQHGATLRASELKPKLDKFLIEKFKEDNVDFSDWLIKGQDKALDYKVRIKSSRQISYYLPLPTKLNSKNYPDKEINLKDYITKKLEIDFEYILPTPYFANADKFKFKKQSDEVDPEKTKPDELFFAVFTNNRINVTITSLNLTMLNGKFLYQFIQENLTEFFLIHNFGTRQNKGFGSFTVEEINEKEVDNDDLLKLLQDIFYKKSSSSYTGFNNIFQFILKEYQLLKSGINIPYGRTPFYEKSKLFEYFIKKDKRWEKRYIKQKLKKNKIELKQTHNPIDYDNAEKNYYNNYTDKQENDYKYIRALLGVAEHFEFATNNRGRIKVKITHKPQNGEDQIKRFQSPLFMKVIDGSVYIKYNDTYKQIEKKYLNLNLIVIH